MNQPLISVIIPVYNVGEFLAPCLDSLLAQTYQNLEILLIDDGSTDDSGDRCDEYAKKDPRFKVTHKENGGISSARNAGMDIAKGVQLAGTKKSILTMSFRVFIDYPERFGFIFCCTQKLLGYIAVWFGSKKPSEV